MPEEIDDEEIKAARRASRQIVARWLKICAPHGIDKASPDLAKARPSTATTEHGSVVRPF
jgi:hypothetical protein